LNVAYRSEHDPANPDGDTEPDEYASTDYPPRFYAQILLSVNDDAALPYPYLAVRVEPDRLSLVEYASGTTRELDSVDAVTAANTWYNIAATFDNGAVTVIRVSEAAGEPIVTLTATSTLLAQPVETAGFTVGKLARYHFRDLEYAATAGSVLQHVKWAYGPYGRKVLQTEYDGAGVVVAQTRYVYDGWQLLQEIDALSETVLAEYTYGPGYIDDIVRVQRNGQTYYHHADQQYSTVALTDDTGTVVERYTYDAFGTPTFRDPVTGTDIGASTVNNEVLYTGRPWNPTLRLYDYRTRQFDPTLGRFTTPDPLGAYGDWNNLGNPYSYTGNNPGSFVDPFGLWGWDADFIEYGVGGFLGFHGTAVASATREGAVQGALEGATVMGDYASFGLTPVHEDAVRIQQNAADRGDVMSQVGFGLGKTGVEATYAATGGMVMSKALTSGRGTAFLMRNAGAVRVAAQVGSVTGAGTAGYSLGDAAVAFSEQDYNRSVHRLGTAGLAALGSGFGAKSAPGKLGKGALRIGSVEPPEGVRPGTTTFGNKMHERVGGMLQKRLGAPDVNPETRIISRLSAGQRGVDIEVPKRSIDQFGFMYSEIKPRSASGARALANQISQWGYDPQDVVPITYGHDGDVYIGF
jgi:RHS repeat-associated protein